ncbi:MAG: methyltransferase domain-containing protein [Candidatus Krumholzibacteriota bacterium]|nr:methyltransferase domain-containing protein [Candidatus Krumholzibacteriota bacterium]
MENRSAPYPIVRLDEARIRLVRLPGLAAPLRLAVPPSPDALLERMDVDAPGAEERIPYWSELWPSAEGLARFLLAGRGPRRPGRVLEIGCGLGLVGLVALRLGWDATLTDKEPEAVRWARRNLALNHLPPARARILDWRDPPHERWDTILAADVLYERPFGAALAAFFQSALAPGGRALVAEPGRPVGQRSLADLGGSFAVRPQPVRTAGARVRVLVIERAAPVARGR